MALIHVNFYSEALGMCAACDVILPQPSTREIGINTRAGAGRAGVLWLLHGMSDNHTIWQRRTSIERYVSPLGLAVVMPNAHLSSYADMAHGGRYFTYIADELPRIMRDFFPLNDERESNYICGLSMGGAGALKIGLARPENYAAIGCLSAGAFNRIKDDDGEWRKTERAIMLYGDRELEGTEEDIYASAARILNEGKPRPRIYHSCGSEDFLLPAAHATRDYFTGLEGDPFSYVYEQDPGAHTWEYWDAHIQRFLSFISKKSSEY